MRQLTGVDDDNGGGRNREAFAELHALLQRVYLGEIDDFVIAFHTRDGWELSDPQRSWSPRCMSCLSRLYRRTGSRPPAAD